MHVRAALTTVIRETGEAVGGEADAKADEGEADAEAKATAAANEAHSLGPEAGAPSNAATGPEADAPERRVRGVHGVPPLVPPEEPDDRHLSPQTHTVHHCTHTEIARQAPRKLRFSMASLPPRHLGGGV